jgi:hypothetical protein
MHIGVDFDNTIACYDEVFCTAARARGLIPEGVPLSKDDVRNYLRKKDNEDAWTELQGYVYGMCMDAVPLFPGALDFFYHCKSRGIIVDVISHKTCFPFLGPKYDLHKSAYNWLASHDLYTGSSTDSLAANVYFELTKQAKLQRIRQAGCTHFIDDLPEFLSEPNFPSGVNRILFDPSNRHVNEHGFPRATSWRSIDTLTLGTTQTK